MRSWLRHCCQASLLTLVVSSTAAAVDYRIEPLKEKAPAGEVSATIGGQLSPSGIRVYRGSKRKICDIWFCRTWAVTGTKKGNIRYPFAQGQLIGVIRYARSGKDFKDQRIRKGVYTLRYAYQPEDGNHVGTFPTRDFLLLVPAKVDKKVESPKLTAIVENSAEGAESAHPALLCLLEAKKPQPKPMIREQKSDGWWVLGTQGMSKPKAGKPAVLPMNLVIVGHAKE